MNANERDEISASVAAHAELGSRYDSAVAEGLVERIGEEIDKRIDARLGGRPRPGGPPAPRPEPAVAPALAPALAPPPPLAQGPAQPHAQPPAERRGPGLGRVVLALGSMGLGLAATAVVVSHHVESIAALFMVLLIWGAIAVINIGGSW